MGERQSDPFFIGWLPIPRASRLYLWTVAIFVVQVAVGTAILVAGAQHSPGPGIWNDDSLQTVEGVVEVDPYPMIRVAGEPDRTILLVEAGKFGAESRARPYRGKPVRLTGTMLHRNGIWMMEVAEGSGAIVAVEMAETETRRLSDPNREDLGPLATVGEIVDSKCYLGAMKPGCGKTHRGCAALCLRGGIPPMLITRDSDDREISYLMVGLNGQPLGEEILPLVGIPVAVTGIAARLHDLHIVRVDPSQIVRR